MYSSKTKLRNGFSDRMGISKINAEIQIHDLDGRTRITLSNLFSALYEDMCSDINFESWAEHLYLDMMWNVFVERVSPGSINSIMAMNGISDRINETIIKGDYDDVLTILEFIIVKMEEIYEKHREAQDLQSYFNNIFLREFVGYRFVNGFITPITDDIEIESIEEATKSEYDNVSKHITKAIYHLSNRENPDYENSIKESISAVEAICVIIVKDDKATLGKAMKKLQLTGGITIHPSLQTAFEKIYGYTSDDESGIRHSAGIGGKNATFEEAKYMVVACSAFINYLKPMMHERKE